MMNSRPASIEKLTKILKLEADMGCRDRAMIGGLAQYVTHWQAEAQGDGIEAGAIDTVTRVLRDYAGVADPEARRRAIEQLLARLSQLSPSIPPLSQPEPPTHATSDA